MASSRILVANWFDYPQYYDIAFQAYTRQEADFIEAACRKYCPFAARRSKRSSRGCLRSAGMLTSQPNGY